MTLDEAIIHAEAKAAKMPNSPCGVEHRQLAGWLTELRLRRATDGDPDWYAIMSAGVSALDLAGVSVTRAGVEWVAGEEFTFRGWIGDHATGLGDTLDQVAYATTFAAQCAARDLGGSPTRPSRSRGG